jgi:hypothetical protein
VKGETDRPVLRKRRERERANAAAEKWHEMRRVKQVRAASCRANGAMLSGASCPVCCAQCRGACAEARAYEADRRQLARQLRPCRKRPSNRRRCLINSVRTRAVVTVGTCVSSHAPHRTVRAAFPHTAPTLGV